MMDRCAIAPVYGVGYNPRVWYMGQYQHFNTQVGYNWAPAIGGPVMPPPPRAPPPLRPPQMPRPMLRPPPGPVYYAAPRVNVLADPRMPMSRPTSEPLHIEIPGHSFAAMSTGNDLLLCTLDELPYLCLCKYHQSMFLSRPQPAHIYDLLRYNAALY